MKNNYLIVFLVLVVLVVGYFVLKNSSNTLTEEQNQSAVATTKLETYNTYQTLATPVSFEDPVIVNTQKPLMYTFTKTLSLGSADIEVGKVAQILADNLYYTGKITNTMDENLTRALNEFQGASGLEMTGSTGPKTRDALTTLARRPGPCAGTNPGVIVLAPNGGQIFHSGQTVQVQWRSCNLSTTARVTIHTVYFDQNNNSAWSLNVLPAPTYATNNDGVETITLPSNALITANGGIFGAHYKMMVFIGSATQDRSDTFFTITP